MEGDNLVCNFKKCRKSLTNVAFVFCDEHGTREFEKSTTCPACQSDISNKFDVVRNNLQPSEQYKSMILAGLKPDVICEIASRAHAFWAYQSYQEKTYQEYAATKSKERCAEIEQYYEQTISKTTTELNILKTQLAASKKDVEETKKKLNEISDKLQERNRQHQKLQSLYEAMRRKLITVSTFEGKETSASSSNINRLVSVNQAGDHDFVFNPRVVSFHGDTPANHVHKKFSINLDTPRQ